MEKNIQETLNFLEKSVSSFHAVDNLKKLLKENGYIELQEHQLYSLEKGKKYFTTRNDTSIIAFDIGENLNNLSFNIVASHTDSPTFKVKPNHDLKNQSYLRLSTEGYGGMLCSPWLDRPLSVAGRVILKTDEGIKSQLINIDRNLLIIPNVAIHFNRQANSGYNFSLATDMIPLLSTNSNLTFKSLLAKELNVDENDIISHDLYLYNREKPTLLGMENELICSSKIDNLECAFTSTMALINSKSKNHINIMCAFDNEEVGSLTRQGADSTFLEDTLSRISSSLGYSKEEYLKAIATSFLVSADNAHAIHPNHPEYSDGLNYPEMNKGIVIKFNAAQSYTSDGISCGIFKTICERANVPTQFFTNRADLRGGGTLGNLSCAHVSIMSVDIGLAQLAMHSSYECAGSKDINYMIDGLKEFYQTDITVDGNEIKLIKE